MKKKSDVKIKIIELTKRINYHDELYYKKITRKSQMKNMTNSEKI